MGSINTPQLSSVLIYKVAMGREPTLLFLINVHTIQEFVTLTQNYNPALKKSSRKKIVNIYKFYGNLFFSLLLVQQLFYEKSFL